MVIFVIRNALLLHVLCSQTEVCSTRYKNPLPFSYHKHKIAYKPLKNATFLGFLKQLSYCDENFSTMQKPVYISAFFNVPL